MDIPFLCKNEGTEIQWGNLYPIFYDFDFPALDPEWTFRYFYERKIF